MKRLELTSADILLLSETFLFKDAEDDLLPTVTDPLCSISRFKPGEIIFDTQNFRRSLAFVLSGKVAVTKDTGGRKRLLMSVLRPGDVFGAAALFCEAETYVTTLTSVGPSRVLFLPDRLLRRLLLFSPVAAENYLRYLSGRIRFLSERIDSLAAPDGPGKLSAWLRAHAEPDGEGWIVDVGQSWSSLASSVGLSRASLYRALDALEEKNVLKRDGYEIKIPDLEAL
ncbi:MAG: Crp/Fnr family transcriptional regulator [Oscillospiraceae bacterium]|jgi:CRP-like cAMP-binding protein